MPKIYFDEGIAKQYDADSTDMFEPAVVEPGCEFPRRSGAERAQLSSSASVPVVSRCRSAGAAFPCTGSICRRPWSQLRAKPGAEDIGVTIGDFATTRVDGTFTLAYLVYNTIENLTTQDEQVQCFQNVAAHLEPGGCFVIEVGVPGLQRLPPGETVRAFHVSPTRLGFDEYDIAAQGLVSHHYWLSDGRLRNFSMPFRYVWPSELDLMARLAGLTLRERWNDWNRAPFTSASTNHVSVWEKRRSEADAPMTPCVPKY